MKQELHDYYLVFGLSDHCTKFWDIYYDYEEVSKRERIAVYAIEAKNVDEAYDVAEQNFPLFKWEQYDGEDLAEFFFDIDFQTVEFCGIESTEPDIIRYNKE